MDTYPIPGYVVVRSDGLFCRPPGQETSYSARLQDAIVYLSAGDAHRNCCHENESVVPLASLLMVSQ